MHRERDGGDIARRETGGGVKRGRGQMVLRAMQATVELQARRRGGGSHCVPRVAAGRYDQRLSVPSSRVTVQRRVP